MSSVARCRGVCDCAHGYCGRCLGSGTSASSTTLGNELGITQLTANGLPMIVVHFSAASNRAARAIAGELGAIVFGLVDVG